MGGQLIHDALDRTNAQKTVALSDANGSWTYGELQHRSRAVANWLSAQKVGRGQRVLLRALADKRVYAFLYGCSRVGAILVPVSPSLKQYQEAQIVRDCDPSLSIGVEGERDGAWATLDAVWANIVAGIEWPSRQRARKPEPTDPLILFYTSGSTAEPKGIVAPQAQITFSAQAIQERLRYERGDVVYCGLPLNFDYGLYQGLLAMLACCRMVIGTDQAIDPAQEIGNHQATVVPVVPALANVIGQLAQRRQPVDHVRLFTNTGDALSLPTVRLLKRTFPFAAVQLMYGLTECKRVSILEPDGHEARPGAVGQPLTGTTVRIVDGKGRTVGPRVVGEIVVSGPNVAAGYWRDKRLTQRTFFTDPRSGERTLRTGDFGYLDEEGYVYLEGRRDHIFKRRGVRTSVAEVEAAALDIPGVQEAALTPPGSDEESVLFVVGDVTQAEMLRGLDERLGRAKTPDRCVIVEQLPRGSTGKIDRNSLRR